MAFGNFLLDKGYACSGAVSKFFAVKFTADEVVGPVTAITDRIAGFAQFGVTAPEIAKGKGAPVRRQGITEAVATGAIGVGVQVQLEADGRVSAAVGASGKRIVGVCVGAPATNANDRIALEIDTNAVVA
jgi:hypothetical protein